MKTHKIKGEDHYQCREVKAERDAGLTRIAELEKRLEVSEAYTIDGIDCRDETIRLLERRISELEAEIASYKTRFIYLYNYHCTLDSSETDRFIHDALKGVPMEVGSE